MQKIKLTQNKYTIVDDKDYKKLSIYKWFCKNGYAARTINLGNGKFKTIWMHRIIIKTPEGKETDHKNLDRLDNRRVNLRICTKTENLRNVFKRANNKSGFKGVHQVGKKWRAYIRVNSIAKHIGMFETKLKAAEAYNNVAKKYFGEYALINK